MNDAYQKVARIARDFEKQTGCVQYFMQFTRKYFAQSIEEKIAQRLKEYDEPLCYTLRCIDDADKRSHQKLYMSKFTTAQAKITIVIETLVANGIRNKLGSRIRICKQCSGTGVGADVNGVCRWCYGYGESSRKPK